MPAATLRTEVGIEDQTPCRSVFQPEFREDLRYWVETDRKVALAGLRPYRRQSCVTLSPASANQKPLKFIAYGNLVPAA